MVLAALDKLLPKEQVHSFQKEPHPLGNQGEIAAYVKSEEEIISILKYAHDQKLSVIPMGRGTKRGFGGTEETADILLCLSEYRGVVEHSEGDMTITVKAGTTIKEITDLLKESKQMLPLDPAWPEQATIGGVIAANDSGCKRLRYGSARDLVIGLRIVYPDGQIIRTGGKVVKNVAGYDMNKLFIGSMGTLGVISEVILKVRPLPKYESLVLLHFGEHQLHQLRPFVVQLLDSTIEPVSLELLNPSINARLNKENGYALALAFEDVESAVRYEEKWVESNLPSGVDMSILSGEEAQNWWSEFSRVAPNGNNPDEASEIGLKIGSKNMDTIDIVRYCDELAGKHGVYVEAHGGSGHGLSRAYVKGSEEHFLSFVEDLRAMVKEKGGYVIVQHASLSLRKKLNVWGEKPAYFPLLEGIKKAIDPQKMMNDKRFVGGI